MEISFVKLTQLLKVAETGNISRAAEELGVSQPALSRSIAAIEARYRLRIFDRGRSGAVLTTVGRMIIAEASELMRGARKLDHNLKLYGRGEAGRLSVGLSPPVAGLVLARIAAQLFAMTPKLAVTTLIRPPQALTEALLKEEIEFFISPDYQIEPDASVQTRRIGTMPADFVVRSGHPLTNRAEVDVADLSDFPVASPIAPDWLSPDSSPAATFACDNFHIMRDLTLDSDVVLICPSSFVRQELADGRLSILEVVGSPLLESSIVVGTARGRTLSSVALKAMALCIDEFASSK